MFINRAGACMLDFEPAQYAVRCIKLGTAGYLSKRPSWTT
jgi:hypothetical protein